MAVEFDDGRHTPPNSGRKLADEHWSEHDSPEGNQPSRHERHGSAPVSHTHPAVSHSAQKPPVAVYCVRLYWA